jgi:ribonucleoside-triphosphate reductase
MLTFQLDDSFIEDFKYIRPDFGFNGLGLVTYYRTYSRLKLNGTKEAWFETVRRVVEGAYSLQKDHIKNNELGWNEKKAQKSAQEMYQRIFEMKFLPPGRMLWALGSPIVHENKIGQALFNCAFVSTNNLTASLEEAVKPFTFMMDMSMVGVGVGFDVKGAETINVCQSNDLEAEQFTIPDSREGWVESLSLFEFDYDLIKGPGMPIKGFGGVSSGPQPLIDLHKKIRSILDSLKGKPLTITGIVDLMNLIGQCVVAGNVRRTAQIALGPADNSEYKKLKDYSWNFDNGTYEGTMAHRAAMGTGNPNCS